MVELEHVSGEDEEWLRATIERHRNFTGSAIADQILNAWTVEVSSFRKVMPRDYKKVLNVLAAAKAEGLDEEATANRVMEAARG
jgi:glutamate synthase (NADPH/NADH) large chain